ncbi:MAG: hypothetical protein JWR74_376, partial [Polaromonas sp.]|nr:hypothetical protein [Polaromonas sp.]
MLVAVSLFVVLSCLMVAFSRLQYISPTIILAGPWALVFGLQWIFADDMISSLMAIVAIFLITLSFAVGELFALQCCGADQIKISVKSVPENLLVANILYEIRLRRVVLLVGGLGVVGAIFYASALGFLEANSFSELLSLPGVAREQIFAGNLQVPLLSRVGFIFAYSGVVLALSYYYFFQLRWWLALPVISVLVLGMSQSGRAGTVLVILQIILVVYLKNLIVLKSSWIKAICKSTLFPGLMLGIVFIGGQFLREGFGSTGGDDIARVMYSLRSYLFGGVSAFASWFDGSSDWNVPTLGVYSFSSFFDALGIFPQAPGIYDEYLLISNSGETSNIFTAYRSFIDDFTYI